MAPLLLIPALALLLGPASAHAENANQQLGDTAVQSVGAAADGNTSAAKEGAGRAFNGGRAEDKIVVARGVIGAAPPLATPTRSALAAKVEPPPSVEQKPATGKLTMGLGLGGAALLGGLQGWFSAGLFGAVTGAGLGLAAAWLFHKGDYGGAFGVTAGAIIGTAFGGPLGGLIGAVVGGVIGHFIGKLFG